LTDRTSGVNAPTTGARERLLTIPFALVWAAHFVQALAMNLYLHLPGFLQGLGAREVEIGIVSGIMAAVAIISRPAVGRVMDSGGRTRVIVAGGVLHTIVCAAYLGIDSFGAGIVVVRALHGIAEAMLFAALFTFAADIVPAARRTEGVAVFGVSGLLPMALAGLLGDKLLARAGYDQLFYTSIAFALIGLLLSLPLREPTVVHGDDGPRRSFWAAALEPGLLPLFFMGTVFATSIAAIFVFLKTYVIETGTGSVGQFMAAYAISASLLRLLFGWLPDRVGPKRVLFPSVVAVVIGLYLLSRGHSAFDVTVAGVLGGLGHGFAFPILVGLVVNRARSSERGSAISLFTAVFDLGVLVGGPAFGAVIGLGGYSMMYASAGTLCLVGLGVFAAWDRRR
jgi:MFS family permease